MDDDKRVSAAGEQKRLTVDGTAKVECRPCFGDRASLYISHLRKFGGKGKRYSQQKGVKMERRIGGPSGERRTGGDAEEELLMLRLFSLRISLEIPFRRNS